MASNEPEMSCGNIQINNRFLISFGNYQE